MSDQKKNMQLLDALSADLSVFFSETKVPGLPNIGFGATGLTGEPCERLPMNHDQPGAENVYPNQCKEFEGRPHQFMVLLLGLPRAVFHLPGF